MARKFPFLSYPIQPFHSIAEKIPRDAKTRLHQHLSQARYSMRLLRYWWAAQALAAESQRLGRPLIVVDVGCERGWLKHFTAEGVVERWVGLDWNPPAEVRQLARYDEVQHANLDEPLPLPSGCADAVVSLHVFEHLLRPGAVISEISRLLKPGGIFLGGSPTMPQWLASWRERHFRRRLNQGKILAGGHITVLSPNRWAALANDVGLKIEFLTGSHAIRWTGSSLENSRLWLRLNQIWGALLPSLGSECYLMARREQLSFAQTGKLTQDSQHHRGWWIAAGAAACIALFGSGVFAVDQAEAQQRQRISSWIDAHQNGDDFFILWDEEMEELCGQRPDLSCAHSIAEVEQLIAKHQQAHLLLNLPNAEALSEHRILNNWRIDSRMDFNGTDYLLIKHNDQGTRLKEYLLGSN